MEEEEEEDEAAAAEFSCSKCLSVRISFASIDGDLSSRVAVV